MEPRVAGQRRGAESTEIDAAVADTPAIEMVGVTVKALRDPERVVAEEVNWRVTTGDFWAIGGLHATGKSDFMAVAAGLHPPARGECRIFGRAVTTGPEPERRAARLPVGLVFAGGRLLQHLTIAENISLPLRYHRDCSQADCAEPVAALLGLVEMTHWAERYPNDIPRNWCQRAGLARALALKPRLLLLDSPLTSLDPRDADWWRELVAALATGHAILDKRPVTVIVTGDDLRPWQGRARQYGILKDGRFRCVGTCPETARSDEALMQELLSPTIVRREQASI